MTAYTGGMPSFSVGEDVGVTAKLNQFRDFGRAFTDAWTSYTPTLTASTTNPTNWTQLGYYMRAGKLVICKWLLTAGASVTAGSGVYRVALPATGNTNLLGGPASCWLLDSSAGAVMHPRLSPTATYAEMYYPAAWPSGANTAVGSGTYPWASGDMIFGALVYEAA